MGKKIWHFSFYAFAVLSLASMAAMSIGAGLFALGFLVGIQSLQASDRRMFLSFFVSSPLLWATIGLFAAAVVSQWNGSFNPPLGILYPGNSVLDLKKFHHFIYPFLLAITWAHFDQEVGKSKFWNFWLGMALVSAFLGFLQFFGGDLFSAAITESRFFRPIGGSNQHFHGQGLMFFHLSFASAMCFAATAGLGRWLWNPKQNSNWRSGVLGFFCFFLLASGAFLSFSRTAWFALPIGIVFMIFFWRPRMGLAFFFGATILFFLMLNTNNMIRNRLQDNLSGMNQRLIVWMASWEMIRDRPLLGVGFGRTGFYSESYGILANNKRLEIMRSQEITTFLGIDLNRTGFFTPRRDDKFLDEKPEFTSHAHNNFMDIFAGMGFLGLLAFSYWWFVLFRSAYRHLKSDDLVSRWISAAALGGFVAFHVNGMTQVNFWDGKTMHTLMIWVGAVLALEWKAKKLPRFGSR